MENKTREYNESLLDFYLEAISIKNAIDGLVSLIERNEERSEEIQMQDLTIIKDVTKAINFLVNNHAKELGKVSGYE